MLLAGHFYSTALNLNTSAALPGQWTLLQH
jgi:hypothetical protein